MINLRINSANVREDAEIAKSIIEGKVKFTSQLSFNKTRCQTFDSHSRIFSVTNEDLSIDAYKDLLKDRKRVLSVTASGDQMLNSILFGGEDITGIDICSFPKYFVALKLAAIETLDEFEYLTYILGDENTPPLSIKFYEKIRENLVDDAKAFWDAIFGIYSEEQIAKSEFFYRDNPSLEFMISNNPYLQENNYEILREKLKTVNIALNDKNLFELSRADFGKFDLILLSNVLDYFFEFYGTEINRDKVCKKFFKGLPLNENGIAVAYNIIYFLNTHNHFNRGSFRTYNSIEEGTYPILREIVTYQNKSKRLSLFGKR